MVYEKIHLKAHYPFLGEDGKDPVLELYLPYNMTEMKRQDQKRPCMLICPGGGYWMVSQRECEPIALHLLPEGYNVFVLTYSVTIMAVGIMVTIQQNSPAEIPMKRDMQQSLSRSQIVRTERCFATSIRATLTKMFLPITITTVIGARTSASI